MGQDYLGLRTSPGPFGGTGHCGFSQVGGKSASLRDCRYPTQEVGARPTDPTSRAGRVGTGKYCPPGASKKPRLVAMGKEETMANTGLGAATGGS